MNFQWLNRAACHGASHYRKFMRTHPAFHRILDEIEDRSGVQTRKMIASQLWTSIELESQCRGSSPTLQAIDSIYRLPELKEVQTPAASDEPVSYWLEVISFIVIINADKLERN